MSPARFSMGIITVLAGLLAAAPPARALQMKTDEEPLTKWLRGERHPVSTSPSLGIVPTTPSMAVTPPAPIVNPTIRVSSRLEPNNSRVHLGETIHLYVELSYSGEPGDIQVERPEELPLLNLAKQGPGGSVTMRVDRGINPRTVIYTYHYLLAPVAEGAASIEPIEIPYRLRGGSDLLRLTTDRFALTILPRRWPWGAILLATFGGLAAIAGAVALARWFVRRRQRAREAARRPPAPTPFERMRGEIDGIRKMFTDGVAKEAYGAVERFVRKALGLCLGGDLRHATISELSERLEQETLDPDVRDRAASLLDRCGRVKFAGYVPTVADQDQVVADCRLLIDDLEKEAASERETDKPESET